MIDTICLLIPREHFTFVDLSSQGAPTWHLQAHTDNYQKYIKNPTVLTKRTNKYYPRLTGYKRNFGNDTNIKIEFSAPKILYGNNLDELKESDFEKLIDTLHQRLKEMGAMVDKKYLINAHVSSVHYSKNIQLQDGFTASHVISEINKVDLRKTFDLARTRFVNNGQSLYMHATSHQMVVYDKIADIGKAKKRAIDKDQTPQQLELFKELKKNKPLDILRFEIRLSKRQKLKSVLKKCGYVQEPTFKYIYNTKISKDIVQLYWNELVKEGSLWLFTVETTKKELLRSIYKANPTITPKRAIYLVGLLTLAKEADGMRELRSLLNKGSSDRTWYRISKDVREASEQIATNKVRSWVKQIDTTLENYKPLIKIYEKI